MLADQHSRKLQINAQVIPYVTEVNMNALQALFSELIELYAYEVETSGALHRWAEHIQQLISSTGITTPDSPFFIWKGERDSFGELYQYKRPAKEIIEASVEGGRNVRLLRNGLVALAYALWEDEYRQRIATETSRPSKNQIKSDVFQDLNKYRQAVLHTNGRLDRDPKVIRLFRKGDVVAFQKEHMYVLFSYLINELNRIGKEYYGLNLDLTMDNYFPLLD